VVILGSTGSIGTQTLDVIRNNPGRLKVLALSANTNAQTLEAQARGFAAKYTALGAREAERLAALPEADIVVNALVGAAGLRASYTALTAGKTLALANKESLVVGGELLMPLARPGQLLPVDSEHSAIFQCLLGENPAELDALWLTASGGPFRGFSRERLATVDRRQALAHPTWKMGAKISIDSATMMNKGLEIIEAHHLFNVAYDAIRVVIHPQSCIHSMTAFRDGSVKAHLGVTDMRIPIQFALSYPERWFSPRPPLDFCQLGDLSFEPADSATFGCLRLAREAGQRGGTLPAVLNAANEVAVAAFLDGRITFLDIERVVEAVMGYHDLQKCESVEQLEAVDREARARAIEEL
jgi:1-deoxy-D-xylulose-5-phosphate reductoisomerase